MNPFSLVYNEFLFRPLFNLLVGITNLIPGHWVGLSIIILTVLVRLVLLPPSLHQARQMQKNQQKMGEVREQISAVKKKHGKDQAKVAEETMKIYRQAGINPASGCLPLLIQLPILIALYRVFFIGIGPENYHYLYTFVSQPISPQLAFFGINLTQPSVVLAALAGILQFFLMKMSTPTPAANPGTNDETAEMMNSMQKNMKYFFPVMTLFISIQLPAALALYWVVSTLFGIIQQYYFKRFLNLSNPTAV